MERHKTSGIPWPVICTALLLAILFAWLILDQGWDQIHVALVIGIVSFGLCSLLLAICLLLSRPAERKEIFQAFTRTIREDWVLITKHLARTKKENIERNGK